MISYYTKVLKYSVLRQDMRDRTTIDYLEKLQTINSMLINKHRSKVKSLRSELQELKKELNYIKGEIK